MKIFSLHHISFVKHLTDAELLMNDENENTDSDGDYVITKHNSMPHLERTSNIKREEVFAYSLCDLLTVLIAYQSPPFINNYPPLSKHNSQCQYGYGAISLH